MKPARTVRIGSIAAGPGKPLFLIAGPCVIENKAICLKIAARLADLSRRQKIPLIFKASYDKANRSAGHSFRGPGMDAGLDILREVKERYGLPVLTDVHSPEQAERAGRVVDVIQIPAFLCRQTDLLLAAGETGCPVNVKKGQFLAPWDMVNVIGKIEQTGNRRILLTERGASFGYNNLVADMRSLLVMRETGYPVIFDATHSVQRPGGAGTASSGDGRWAPALARAAVATGCDGVFIETHVDPAKALSDKDNLIPLAHVGSLWKVLKQLHEIVC
ncbi:MAG: 3-deoxy-8-phosphooctulonate synthase [Lentisphaerae bacterium RIFOXYC12_FULL_60_16]|nr:MAG: 3-deoxy-8-phosphooctulonate synthase [Lentisphaerae bacterium RIFOXYC12_FULL_60_16]OGV84371.1 MAG: 3-deoxy-8-phosphooctulonate synthase [Lentisphaerae bacterium RIFOXYB12_FULL_60_10]